MKVCMLGLGLFELVLQAPAFVWADPAAYRGALSIPDGLLDSPGSRVLFGAFIAFIGLVRLSYCFTEKDNAGAYILLVFSHAVELVVWYALAFCRLNLQSIDGFLWIYQVFTRSANRFYTGGVGETDGESQPKGREHDHAALVVLPVITLLIAVFGGKGGILNISSLFRDSSKLKTVDQVVIFMQMVENIKEEEDLVMVLEKVGSLCVGNDTNCSEFAKSAPFWSALKTVLQSGRLCTSQTLAKYGCRAINNLARNNDENKVKLGQSGACEELARAMRAHSSNSEVAQWGCRAVGNLAFNNDNRAKQGTSGACEEVTRALKLHPSNRLVAQWGCRAVTYLAHNNTVNKAKLGTAGACDEVSGALIAHLGSSDVAEQGCLAIQELATSNADNKTRLRAAGAESGVALVLARSDMGEAVKREARRALQTLN